MCSPAPPRPSSQRYAPRPRPAHQRVPSAGAEATPSSRRPSTSQAISVAQTGTPRAKLCVPSIGSTIHLGGGALELDTPMLSPSSSPRMECSGNRSRMRARINASASVSATVTSVPSALRRAVSAPRKCRIVTASAASASSRANASRSAVEVMLGTLPAENARRCPMGRRPIPARDDAGDSDGLVTEQSDRPSMFRAESGVRTAPDSATDL